MKEVIDSHHKPKAGFDAVEMGCLAVDIAGYTTVCILVGMLFVNIFGPVG